MKNDKVIEVLEKWHKYAPDYIQDDILQAISLIKENGELRKYKQNLLCLHRDAKKQADDAITELKAKYEELEKFKDKQVEDAREILDDFARTEKELADLKKAVDSEGLGVEEIEKIVRNVYGTLMQEAKQSQELMDARALEMGKRTIVAIHEAQTKYKKKKGE